MFKSLGFFILMIQICVDILDQLQDPNIGEKVVDGCYVHLRIVHQTDGPAWMNHLTN